MNLPPTVAQIQRQHVVLELECIDRMYLNAYVVFVGVAREKMRVPRTIRKAFAPGGTIPWIAWSTAMVNACYF